MLGERIRERRLMLSLSQDEVANLIGMNVSNFGKIERGLINPRFYTIVRIGSVLDLDPGRLLDGMNDRMLPEAMRSFSAKDYVRERRARRG